MKISFFTRFNIDQQLGLFVINLSLNFYFEFCHKLMETLLGDDLGIFFLIFKAFELSFALTARHTQT